VAGVSDSLVRRSAYFSGRVQGVGFRYTTRQISQRYAVTGFVRNLPDRRVEVVAEGPSSEVEQFLNDLSENMRDNIRDTQITQSSPTGEFVVFEIRH
jgi:acylphosphatase